MFSQNLCDNSGPGRLVFFICEWMNALWLPWVGSRIRVFQRFPFRCVQTVDCVPGPVLVTGDPQGLLSPKSSQGAPASQPMTRALPVPSTRGALHGG